MYLSNYQKFNHFVRISVRIKESAKYKGFEAWMNKQAKKTTQLIRPIA